MNTAKVTYNATNQDGTSEVRELAVKRMILNNTAQLLELKLSSRMVENMTYELIFSYVGALGTFPFGFYKARYSLREGVSK